jgi:hypothetical protein
MNRECLYKLIRSFGYTTAPQTDELVGAIFSAMPPSEPVYEAMATDEDHIENGPKDIWMDCERVFFDQMQAREDMRTCILYTAPPSDKFVSIELLKEKVEKMKEPLDSSVTQERSSGWRAAVESFEIEFIPEAREAHAAFWRAAAKGSKS